jgi:hypothetical protein
MRIPADGEVPPIWPAKLLVDMADTAAAEENVNEAGEAIFEVGSIINCAIESDSPTSFQGFCVVEDPQVEPFECSAGSFELLHLVGLSKAELERIKKNDFNVVVDEIAKRNPLFITVP